MKKKRNKHNNNNRNYAKYSGIAFEMLGIIFLGTLAGYKLDEHTAMEFPIFTLCLSLLSVFAALYVVLKDFIK
jgi:F0F1-type ATP synthase assembly protein I